MNNSDSSKLWVFCFANNIIYQSSVSYGMFISCLFDDLAVAMNTAPVFILPFMITAGFFVSSNQIPV
jgi:hypothetical protein